jgi:hypothetical protein
MSRSTPPDTTAGDNPRALWSLLLGVVALVLTGLCGYGLVIGLPAVYLGWQAKDQPKGRGLAIGGIVTGGLAITLGVVWLILLATGGIGPPAGA